MRYMFAPQTTGFFSRKCSAFSCNLTLGKIMANNLCGALGTAMLDKLSVQLGNPDLESDCAWAFANGVTASKREKARQRATLVFMVSSLNRLGRCHLAEHF